MPNLFPCPNPQCSYQFDADMLPAAAMVTCPLCRTRFPYRAAQPAPVAVDDTYAPPPEAASQPSARVVNIRNQPKSGSPLMIVVWILGFGAVAAGAVAYMNHRGNLRKSKPDTVESQERLNFTMDKFPEGWSEDMTARQGLDVNVFARKRTGPDGWVAMYAEDFKDRSPRAGELRDKMLARLKGYGRNMNFVELSDAKWMDQPGQGYQFQGDFGETPVLGESVAVAYKGIAYIYYAWAPDKDWAAVKDELTAMRGRVKLAGYREKWTEATANTKVYTNASPAYSVEDTDAAWQMAAPPEEGVRAKKSDYAVDPKEIDPAASFAFRARFQIKVGGDTRQHAAEAKALVVELKQADDPLETVTQHVIERIKRDYAGNPPEVKLEPMAKSPAGVPLPANGPAMARLLFRDPLDKDNRVMYILSAINADGMTIGVEAEVLERNANYVEEWMVHLAGSLKGK